MNIKYTAKILISIAIAFFLTTYLFKGIESPSSFSYMAYKVINGVQKRVFAKKDPLPPEPTLFSVDNPVMTVRAEGLEKRRFFYKGKWLEINANTNDIPQTHLEFFYNLQVAKEATGKEDPYK